MRNKWQTVIPVIIWLMLGIYGVFFNITYIDEAKYLIKGWLMATGQVGYYSTPEFFYQHMPGGLLWYGFGQKIFGPSLLAARMQSFLLGLLILLASYKLTKLINPKASKIILWVMSLAPVAILYYSAAVPQSLAALSLVLGFLFLFKNKIRQATIIFSLCFIIRENFLFTLIIYWIYLLVTLKKNWKELVINGCLSLGTLGVFLIPGWPGIGNVLKNFPGISFLLPINEAEKAVLDLNWMQITFNFSKYIQAAKEFGEIYFSFILTGIIALAIGWKNKKIFAKDSRWIFLLIVFGVNFLAHAWSASQLSPRAIIPYWAYIYPLAAVIIASLITKIKLKYYWLLLVIALIGINLSSIYQPPKRLNTIQTLEKSSTSLRPFVNGKDRIIWLAEPMSLYLSGKVSYYPLINHTNFLKLSMDTNTIKGLGFWNLPMMEQWLKEADLVVIDNNRLILLSNSPKAALFAEWLENKLKTEYIIVDTPKEIWPSSLSFYERSFSN